MNCKHCKMLGIVLRVLFLAVLILQCTSLEREEYAINKALDKLSSLAKNATNHWLDLMKSTFDVEIEVLGINHTLNSFLRDIQDKSDDAASRDKDWRWCLGYGREKQLKTYANNATFYLRVCTKYHYATAVYLAREPMQKLFQAPQVLNQAMLDFWTCQNGFCDAEVFSKYPYLKSNITTLIEDTTFEMTNKISVTFASFGECVGNIYKKFLTSSTGVYNEAIKCYSNL